MTTTIPAKPPIAIRSVTGQVLHESTAMSVRDAVEAAVRDRADMSGANLRGAYLSGAYLSGAYLSGAYLYRSNLSGANLRGANLDSTDGFAFDAGPSGYGWIIPTTNGKYDRAGQWRITIGCWRDRTLADLRALIADEVDWPEAKGEERERRRPYLRAVLALCEAHLAYVGGAE